MSLACSIQKVIRIRRYRSRSVGLLIYDLTMQSRQDFKVLSNSKSFFSSIRNQINSQH